MTTPKMLIMQDVKTPSHVPNRTGSEMKKFDCHHGRVRDDCKTNNPRQKRTLHDQFDIGQFQTGNFSDARSVLDRMTPSVHVT